MKKVALVIGHNLAEQGATNYLNETEFEFNLKVANLVSAKVQNTILKRIIKSDKYLSDIYNFNPDLIIELHFNSYPGQAFGCEALTVNGSEKAVKLLNQFSKAFKIRNRGLKIVNPGSRGYQNFRGLDNYEMFLFEPCFGNTKTKESVKIIENWQNYSTFLANFLDNLEKPSYNIIDKMLGIIRAFFKE